MIEKYTILPDATVKDTIHLLERENADCAFITDKNDILLGIFTQGDMRRFMLTNGDMTSCITKVMNSKPITFASREEAIYESKKGKLISFLSERM